MRTIAPLATFVTFVMLVASAAAQEIRWVHEGNAPWKARDSQGEVVFDDKLWIFGGWFDSFQAPPRDVWSSADGKSWEKVTDEAPWKHSDLPMTIAFDKRMWLMGGWHNGRLEGRSASNEVWSSTDGKDWRQVTAAAGWTPRIAAAVVEFQGEMFLLGGTEKYYYGDEKSLKNDVWKSKDGREWKQVTDNAGWSPRAYHQAAVLDGKLYVFGGGNYDPPPLYHAKNDVWVTENGKDWRQVTEAAPWSPRLWFSSAVYRDRMWVIGGWSNHPSKNWPDVWHSADGKTWKELKLEGSWKERHEHSAFVFQDKLWVAGGHAQPLSNEVWSLALPKDWKPE